MKSFRFLFFLSLVSPLAAATDETVLSDSFTPGEGARAVGAPLRHLAIEQGSGRWRASDNVILTESGAAGALERSGAAGVELPLHKSIVSVEADVKSTGQDWVASRLAGPSFCRTGGVWMEGCRQCS